MNDLLSRLLTLVESYASDAPRDLAEMPPDYLADALVDMALDDAPWLTDEMAKRIFEPLVELVDAALLAGALVVTSSEAATPSGEQQHTQDSDCTLDADDICTECGVQHGDPCDWCGGRGYHACERCPVRFDCGTPEFEAATIAWDTANPKLP